MVFNERKGERILLDPEDEELLHDDDPINPIQTDGLKREERPTEEGASELVETKYLSPLSMDSTKQSLTEKQAKELQEPRGQKLLENNSNREQKIRDIMASFEACKFEPIHAANHQLQPKRVLPFFPYFDRYNDQFLVANFDSAPTADSEIYRKLSVADHFEHENRVIMEIYEASSSDIEEPENFLAYMVRPINELEKDMHDENEDISYSWVQEYDWDVQSNDVDDAKTYLVAFGESEARYLPLRMKLILTKKKAKEGKSGDELEHFPVPKTMTGRSRPTVNSAQLREEGDFVASRTSTRMPRSGLDSISVNDGRLRRIAHDTDVSQSSGAEDDMSD